MRIRGDQNVQSEVLEGLAAAVKHRQWFAALALPYLGDEPIEIGSGLGHYAIEWAPYVRRFTATEADPDRLVRLKERCVAYPNITVRDLVLPTDEVGGYTAAIAYNVLEHIEDDVQALCGISGLVRPGSPIVLVVPAFPFAMSPVDVATGHVRRYTRRTLTRTLLRAGLTVQRLRYVNALGLVGYYLTTSVLRLTPRDGAMIRAYDRWLLPVTRALEQRGEAPFGQSIFAVARTRR